MDSSNANAFFPQKNNKIFNLLPIKVFSNFLLWQNISNIQIYIYNKHLSPRSWQHSPPAPGVVYNSHPSECEMLSHGFELYFPNDSDIDYLYMCLADLHSYSCPLLILNGVFVFYCCIVGVLCIFWILISYQSMICKYFLRFYVLTFHSVVSVRWCIQALLLA